MKETKFDSKDAIILMLGIVCIALIIAYFSLSNSYNILAEMYGKYCYLEPSKQMLQDQGYNILGNITGLI